MLIHSFSIADKSLKANSLHPKCITCNLKHWTKRVSFGVKKTSDFILFETNLAQYQLENSFLNLEETKFKIFSLTHLNRPQHGTFCIIPFIANFDATNSKSEYKIHTKQTDWISAS